MISKELLLESKYKEFDNGWQKRLHPDTYITSFQKRFDDKTGKKYFITLDLFDFSEFRKDYKDSWICDTQFYIPKSEGSHDDETFNVEYFIYQDTMIEMIEKFYEKIWVSIGCRYYEKWSEC